MNKAPDLIQNKIRGWDTEFEACQQWLKKWEHALEPGFKSEPSIKVLIFLALLEANQLCNYDEIRNILYSRNLIKGKIPDNTMRTSMLNLNKTLVRSNNGYSLKSSRGRFKIMHKHANPNLSGKENDPVVLILNPPAITAEEIASDLIKKAVLPFHALYFLERSARWWEIFSSNEAEIRVEYEYQAWETLGIKNRLSKTSSDILGFVGLGPGEGLAEIKIIKQILENKNTKIHYMAVDSSQRLLRDHICLLKETLHAEIEEGRLLCSGVIANIFSGLSEGLKRVRKEFYHRGITASQNDFLPSASGLLVTYLGNCLGNNFQDMETDIFSIIYSTFQNRPLEILVGVSVMRPTQDSYKRNWDDFLLQTPKHLLETKGLLKTSRTSNSNQLPEFTLNKIGDNDKRCPPVTPESYIVRHKIEGQIYRFYYKLAFDLSLAHESHECIRPLPKNTLILLYNIIKYKMKSLVQGIEKYGLYKIEYDSNFHQIINTPNGKREYAVFCAYSER